LTEVCAACTPVWARGDLSHDLRRGRQSSPWIAFWAL